MLELAGRFAPLLSAFTDDGSSVSEIRLSRLVRKVSNLGVDGFVLCTETGEFGCLSFSERKTLLELVLRDSHNALPVIVNVSTLGTTASLDLAQHASRHGARAVIVMPPYYGAFSVSELEGHYRTILRYSTLPVICVDPQSRMSKSSLETLANDGRFYVANSATATDHFSYNDLKVDPVYCLTMEPRPELESLIGTYGGAKVLKAAYEEDDLEMGRLRPPAQGLNHEQAREVIHALRPPEPPIEPEGEVEPEDE